VTRLSRASGSPRPRVPNRSYPRQTVLARAAPARRAAGTPAAGTGPGAGCRLPCPRYRVAASLGAGQPTVSTLLRHAQLPLVHG
jgi:hypothetical protein